MKKTLMLDTRVESIGVRNYFAGIIAAALAVRAIPGSHNSLEGMEEEIPKMAVTLADALIKELNQN